MPVKNCRFLSEQLQLVLDEINGPYTIDSKFIRDHLGSINEHAVRLMDTLPLPAPSKPNQAITLPQNPKRRFTKKVNKARTVNANSVSCGHA